jgi:hypothetical protein
MNASSRKYTNLLVFVMYLCVCLESSIENPSNEYWRWHFKYDDKLQIEATPYEKDYLGPFPNRKRNQVAFTTKQVEAILHGMKQGLSLVSVVAYLRL